nr:flagellar type III secretion system pore protein FliP [Oxobacter pfennigii]
MTYIAYAQPARLPIPNIGIQVGQAENPQDYVDSIKLMIIITILALVPSFIVLMTSFTRIVVVLSFVRNALSTQQTPPNQVLIGLALFLTLFIMAPVYTTVNEEAIKPYLEETITQQEAIEIGSKPIRDFMLKQTRQKDLALFISAAQLEQPEAAEDVPFTALIPAFVISELKTAFQIGFLIYIPFIVIDMIVASILMSMGMFMLPPVTISLPFKLLLFVMVDGWYLVVKSLLESFA